MKPNAQIRGEASAWFVEFSEGDVPLELRQEFSQWLRASPEHVRTYLQVASTFEDLGALAQSRKGDAEELVRRALADGNVVELEGRRVTAPADAETPARVGSSVSATHVAPRRFRHRAHFAAAAALTAVAIGAGGWQLWHSGVYSTGVGEQRLVNLADGSTIELNADSRIRVRLRDRERTVDLLEGQALFHVAKDPGRPFIVRSDLTSVRAVGTQFDVNRETSETVVSVLEGRVAVARTGYDLSSPSGSVQGEGPSAPGPHGGTDDASLSTDTGIPTDARPLYLSAGEQVILTAQAVSKPTHPDVAAATAWRERKLIFASSPLTDVAGEYNRYHEKRLRVADPALKDFRISGVFSAADAASLIAFLKAQPNIEVEEKDGEIVLKSR